MSNREKTKWVVDGMYMMDDGSIELVHSTDKTIMIIYPVANKIPKSDPPEFSFKFNIREPDCDERLYYLHKHGVIGDEEFSVEMTKQPKQKRLAIIAKLQQEVDNVPG